MKKILNTYIQNKDNTTTIMITKTHDKFYLKEILIDTDCLYFFLNKTIYVDTGNYAKVKPKRNITHLLLNHKANRKLVVDHINGNRLDNRKCNLRIVTAHQNTTNITKVKSNTGIQGVSERKRGNYHYFRASVSDISDVVDYSTGRTRRYSKQFNINKLGRKEALKQASEWVRIKKIEFGYLSAS